MPKRKHIILPTSQYSVELWKTTDTGVLVYLSSQVLEGFGMNVKNHAEDSAKMRKKHYNGLSMYAKKLRVNNALFSCLKFHEGKWS